MTKKERILLFLLASINFTHIMDFMIVMPLGTYLIPLFKLSPSQFSLIVTSYAISASIMSFCAAFFVDRFDRKKVLLTGYIGFILGTFACGLAPSYEFLLAARILAGTFGGLISAQVLSIVADSFEFERRGRAMSAIMAAFAFASAIGVPFGLLLSKYWGWHIPFIVIGCLGIIIIPLVMLFIPKMDKHIQSLENRPSPISVITNIFKNNNQLRALLFMIILMMGHFSIIPFIANYMEYNVGFSKNQVILIYLVGGVVSMVSSPIIGKLADKKGKLQVFIIFAILATIPIFLITNMPRIYYGWVLIVTSLFFIFAGGRIIPAQAIITSVVTPQQRGGFMSINSALQQLSTGLSALIAGLIIEKTDKEELLNYQYVGYIGIVLSILCIFIARKVKPVS